MNNKGTTYEKSMSRARATSTNDSPQSEGVKNKTATKIPKCLPPTNSLEGHLG